MSIVKDLFLVSIIIIMGIKYILLYKKIVQQRNYFIQTLSHDLRVSTIAQIRGLELFQKNKDYDLLSYIDDSCKLTLDMINMLLSAFRYENGEQVLNYELCNLLEIFNQTKNLLLNFCKEKNITFKASINKNCWINADKQALTKVFSILISTAIFYSEKNTIINISAKNINQELIVNIDYKGKALSEEEQKRMFYKNSRFSTVGHGIRMHLCKKIIDYHNGNIQVNSNRHNINSFIFRIPEKSVLEPKPAIIPNPSICKLKVFCKQS